MPSRPKIVLLGDSLTQLSFEGWGAALANAYQRRCDILNRGYSGYNTKMYLEHIMPRLLGGDGEDEEDEGDVSWTSVALCIIFFGANDAALKEVDPHHHVPLYEYGQNLIDMIDLIHTHVQKKRERRLGSKSSPSDTGAIPSNEQRLRFLLVTPPPVHHGQRLAYQRQRYGDRATGVLERTNEVTGKYAEACIKQVQGELLDIPVLNLYDEMMKRGNFEELLCDGLHFSPAGHEFVAQHLLDAIREHFPGLEVLPDPVTGQFCNLGSRCTEFPSNGPYHDEIS
jgi:lysophospholipase L1-like esterase